MVNPKAQTVPQGGGGKEEEIQQAEKTIVHQEIHTEEELIKSEEKSMSETQITQSANEEENALGKRSKDPNPFSSAGTKPTYKNTAKDTELVENEASKVLKPLQ